MTETVAKPLDKIKKIRSLDEILTRGGQAISVYREQRRGSDIPTDEEFVGLIDRSHFGKAPVIAETLWHRFYKNAESRFFAPFRDPATAAQVYAEIFGFPETDRVIAAAENILDGRIDLMGYKGLFVGRDVDWHREPLTAKRSPMRHWKQFDDLDTRETGNKKIVWELNRHQHFFTLGLAFCLTEDERFARAFVRQLESWMESNPPGIGINWSSSLEVAFRAMSWIWAFHLFRESEAFTPELFHRAIKHLYCHGRHIEQYLSKYYSPNTHLTGEALGLYYLGTQIPSLERAATWRKVGEEILMAEINKQVLPDGVYFEQSTWYQRYTADIYSHFVILRALQGDRYYIGADNEIEDRLEKCLYFLRHATMPDGITPLIGDDDGGRLLPLSHLAADDFSGTLSVGAVLFDNGDLKLSDEPAQDVFWLLGEQGIRSYSSLFQTHPQDTSVEFPDGGYAVMRDGWGETDNMLLVDCGEIGALSGGHGHADALAIVAAVHGRPLLVDSGTYTYHDSKELRDHFRSTAAHNVLTIDNLPSSAPGHAFGWNSRAVATWDKWIGEDRFDFFAGRHDGYRRLDSPAAHHRSILFIKGDYWIMRDAVETTGTHEYALNFHYAHERRPAIGNDDGFVGEDDHRIYVFGDHGAWQQKESWVSTDHGSRVNAPLMRFVSVGEGTQEFWTFIVPANGDVNELEIAEVPMVEGRAFAVKFGCYTDVLVFNDEAGKSIDNGIFESNFKYSWARLADGDIVPEEFVLIEGDRLRLNGDDVLQIGQAEYTAMRRLGSELYVKSGANRYTTRLPLAPRQ